MSASHTEAKTPSNTPAKITFHPNQPQSLAELRAMVSSRVMALKPFTEGDGAPYYPFTYPFREFSKKKDLDKTQPLRLFYDSMLKHKADERSPLHEVARIIYAAFEQQVKLYTLLHFESYLLNSKAYNNAASIYQGCTVIPPLRQANQKNLNKLSKRVQQLAVLCSSENVAFDPELCLKAITIDADFINELTALYHNWISQKNQLLERNSTKFSDFKVLCQRVINWPHGDTNKDTSNIASFETSPTLFRRDCCVHHITQQEFSGWLPFHNPLRMVDYSKIPSHNAYFMFHALITSITEYGDYDLAPDIMKHFKLERLLKLKARHELKRGTPGYYATHLDFDIQEKLVLLPEGIRNSLLSQLYRSHYETIQKQEEKSAEAKSESKAVPEDAPLNEAEQSVFNRLVGEALANFKKEHQSGAAGAMDLIASNYVQTIYNARTDAARETPAAIPKGDEKAATEKPTNTPEKPKTAPGFADPAKIIASYLDPASRVKLPQTCRSAYTAKKTQENIDKNEQEITRSKEEIKAQQDIIAAAQRKIAEEEASIKAKKATIEGFKKVKIEAKPLTLKPNTTGAVASLQESRGAGAKPDVKGK